MHQAASELLSILTFPDHSTEGYYILNRFESKLPMTFQNRDAQHFNFERNLWQKKFGNKKGFMTKMQLKNY